MHVNRYNLKSQGLSDKYKNVYKFIDHRGVIYWNAMITITDYSGIKKKCKPFNADQEREAAKWIDMRLIEAGKDPVNILTKKTC
jgi:hypothetical protein